MFVEVAADGHYIASNRHAPPTEFIADDGIRIWIRNLTHVGRTQCPGISRHPLVGKWIPLPKVCFTHIIVGAHDQDFFRNCESRPEPGESPRVGNVAGELSPWKLSTVELPLPCCIAFEDKGMTCPTRRVSSHCEVIPSYRYRATEAGGAN